MLIRMKVRLAEPSDSVALAEVIATVAQEDLLATEPPVDVSARAGTIREGIETGAFAAWVLESDGVVVGTAGVHKTEVEGVLSLGIAILPAARRSGGGRALMEATLQDARERRAHKVELEVWPQNARALAFYESAGFDREGLRRAHYRRRDGTLRSAVLMARLIGDD